MFTVYDVMIEVYVGNEVVNRQRMQAPKQLLMVNFMQLVNQVANEQSPMKVKMFRQEVVYDNFENKQKILNNEIEFMNNAMAM